MSEWFNGQLSKSLGDFVPRGFESPSLRIWQKLSFSSVFVKIWSGMPSDRSTLMKKSKKSWQAYILKCGDGSLYTGSTNDLESRIKTHSSGNGAKYTRSRLPVELVYKEKMFSRSAAAKREAEIKKLSRKEKLVLIAK